MFAVLSIGKSTAYSSWKAIPSQRVLQTILKGKQSYCIRVWVCSFSIQVYIFSHAASSVEMLTSSITLLGNIWIQRLVKSKETFETCSYIKLLIGHDLSLRAIIPTSQDIYILQSTNIVPQCKSTHTHLHPRAGLNRDRSEPINPLFATYICLYAI